MNIFEIISAIVLIIACVFIVVIVLMKDTKTQMSQSISGTSSDSFFQKNAGRTKEAMLNKATIAAVIVFFVLALAVNVINVYAGGKEDEGSSVTSDISDIVDSGTSSETSGTSSETSNTSSETSGTSSETSGTSSETSGTSSETSNTSSETSGTSSETSGTSSGTSSTDSTASTASAAE